ncbi:hypothetical protein M9434_007130 [Picochlorum sp. BPE23]|nr:hypothetical protein M9434_007130 [Picochlorum sp. BPE23]
MTACCSVWATQPHWRTNRRSGRVVRVDRITPSASHNDEARVLDSFWYSRGVVNDESRQLLVELSLTEVVDRGDVQTAMQGGAHEDEVDIPGVSSTWDLMDGSKEVPASVVWASQRILDLHRFLGSREDIDVVWMVQREPKLLDTSIQQLTKRLLELRIDDASDGVDVAKLVQQQPALLLDTQEMGTQDDGDNTGAKLEAWKHGLLSGDGENEWNRRLEELVQYRESHGDCHCGYRDNDPQSLRLWCKKQRKEYKNGNVSKERVDKLREIGFEFDEDFAEWKRWYNEYIIADSQGTDANLTKPQDFYLINWCSIQRIAKRSKVLHEERIQLLDEAGFDWTKPDALS